MGLTFASAVRLLAKQSLVEQRMPFVISKKLTLAGGLLSRYADKSKWEEEEKALEREMVKKHE